MLKTLRLLRFLVCGAAGAVCAETTPVPASSVSFSYQHVVAEAHALVTRPYAAETERVPRFYLELFADQFREIRFRPEQSIWSGTDSPWHLRLLHPGLSYNRIARLYVVEAGRVREITYDPARFSFGNLPAGAGDQPAGHAGFSLSGQVNQPGVQDEFVVFAGGTQFRCLPGRRGAVFGLSARGLAVNTAVPGMAEDFPLFKKYWIERQPAGSVQAVVYALMDSPHLCGAYRFTVLPGTRTVTEVEATLFFREKVQRLGLVPFSAMFWYGENTLRKPDDYRPEVHSADGILVEDENGRAWWRPLVNGLASRHSSFAVEKLAGFGMRQRDTAFGNYQDLDAAFHRRPGVWVEPLEDWPNGAVHLIEQPTGQEVWDNVVCYWQPDPLPAPGSQLYLRYRITWAMESDFLSALAKVTSTHVGRKPNEPRLLNYVVDFSPIPGESGETEAPQAQASVTGAARLVRQNLVYNPETHGWRVALEVEPAAPNATYELKAVLLRNGREISENWDYLATAAP